MASFPPEIIDYVLSLLKKDKAALTLCSEASPLLSAVAERYFYEHITLDTTTKPLEQIFHLYLASHPRASFYVKSITVLFSVYSTLIKPLPHSPDSKRLTEASNQANLPRLPVLETLFLTTQPNNSVSWIAMQEHQRNIWLKLACLPTLKNLVFRGIFDFPFYVLDRCRNLKRIELLGESLQCALARLGKMRSETTASGSRGQ